MWGTDGFAVVGQFRSTPIALAIGLFHDGLMDIKTLAKSIVDQATAGLANHLWDIEELVNLMGPKSVLDGLTQTA